MKVAFYVAFLALVMASPALAQDDNRLDSGPQNPPPSSGNQTTNQTAPPNNSTTTADSGDYADKVTIIFTDHRLYGFTDTDLRAKRLGQNFSLYIIPKGGDIEYRVLLDDAPLKLNNGFYRGNASEMVEEKFSLPNLRIAKFIVEVYRGNETETYTYGKVRLIPIGKLTADDDEEEDPLTKQIRQFSGSEWTWYRLKWGLVGLACLVGGLVAGYLRGKEREESTRVVPIAN